MGNYIVDLEGRELITIGQFLKKRMKEAGITQTSMARHISKAMNREVTQNFFSKITRDEKVMPQDYILPILENINLTMTQKDFYICEILGALLPERLSVAIRSPIKKQKEAVLHDTIQKLWDYLYSLGAVDRDSLLFEKLQLKTLLPDVYVDLKQELDENAKLFKVNELVPLLFEKLQHKDSLPRVRVDRREKLLQNLVTLQVNELVPLLEDLLQLEDSLSSAQGDQLLQNLESLELHELVLLLSKKLWLDYYTPVSYSWVVIDRLISNQEGRQLLHEAGLPLNKKEGLVGIPDWKRMEEDYFNPTGYEQMARLRINAAIYAMNGNRGLIHHLRRVKGSESLVEAPPLLLVARIYHEFLNRPVKLYMKFEEYLSSLAHSIRAAESPDFDLISAVETLQNTWSSQEPLLNSPQRKIFLRENDVGFAMDQMSCQAWLIESLCDYLRFAGENRGVSDIDTIISKYGEALRARGVLAVEESEDTSLPIYGFDYEAAGSALEDVTSETLLIGSYLELISPDKRVGGLELASVLSWRFSPSQFIGYLASKKMAELEAFLS